VRRGLAARKVWGTGSVWVAGSEPEPAPVQATVVHVVHVVHHYLPLPGGTGEQARQLSQHRDAITAGGEDDDW